MNTTALENKINAVQIIG